MLCGTAIKLLLTRTESAEKYFSCQPNDLSVVVCCDRPHTLCEALRRKCYSRACMCFSFLLSSFIFCTRKKREKYTRRWTFECGTAGCFQLSSVRFAVTTECKTTHCRPQYHRNSRLRWCTFSLTSAGNVFCVEYLRVTDMLKYSLPVSSAIG